MVHEWCTTAKLRTFPGSSFILKVGVLAFMEAKSCPHKLTHWTLAWGLEQVQVLHATAPSLARGMPYAMPYMPPFEKFTLSVTSHFSGCSSRTPKMGPCPAYERLWLQQCVRYFERFFLKRIIGERKIFWHRIKHVALSHDLRGMPLELRFRALLLVT